MTTPASGLRQAERLIDAKRGVGRIGIAALLSRRRGLRRFWLKPEYAGKLNFYCNVVNDQLRHATDEPTIGLAPAVVDTIAEIIQTIGRNGVDVLLVEQNAEIAFEISEDAYIFERGELVMRGTAREMMNSPEVQRAYLGI